MLGGHRLRALSLALALVLTTSTVLVTANDDVEVMPEIAVPTADASVAEDISSAWFVQLASAPAAHGTDRARLAQERDAVRAGLKGAGINFSERFAFDTLWNGLSVDASPSAAARIARVSGVTGVYPVITVAAPTTAAVSEPELWTALLQSGANVSQAAGFTGAGIKVAVMDTGIDYHHPDLGGCFGAGCRVTVGRDFVGDGFNAAGSTAQELVARPDNDPDDCGGHGTHVAGIIGASGNSAAGGVRGVAPDVTFGAYRVFGCVGSTTADIMIAAMERAHADGMQVLNMSIGSAFQWPTYPTAVAASNLVDAGVVVVASIGNSGANGVYSTGAPGNGDKVIGVASFDNTHVNSLTFNVTTSGRQVPYQQLSSTTTAPTSGTSAEIVHVGRGCVKDPALSLAADDPYLNNPAGKVALIERGLCTFNTKYQRAIDAGAVGVIVYAAASAPSLFIGGSVVDRGYFGISVARADGQHLAAQSSPRAEWTDVRIAAPVATGNTASSFTSYGHSPDLSLKPDIGGPGGLIYSTVPLEQGRYAVLSGTSMSSPHVAGAVAAYLQAKPGTAAADVRTILQNSADPKPWSVSPGAGFLEFVHRQGAGMIDIPGAINATTLVSPGKLALGESSPTPSQTRALTIRNNSSSEVTYTLGHAPALASGGSTFSPSAFASFATVSFSSASVVVPAGGTASVSATITAPAAAGRQYGGYLVVTGGGATYRVPYAGFSGDYQSISALTPTTNALPWLAKRTGRNVDPAAPIKDWTKQATGAVFTLKKNAEFDDVPWVIFHLDHQASRVTLDVHNADGSLWGRVLDTPNFGRNSTATSFFTFQWDGKGAALASPKTLNVKNASYYFKLTVLKALGDPNNAAHVQTWQSPTFTVERELEDESAP